jgi:hypothetical protein
MLNVDRLIRFNVHHRVNRARNEDFVGHVRLERKGATRRRPQRSQESD